MVRGLAAALVACATLAACSGDDEPAATSEPTEQTTVSIAGSVPHFTGRLALTLRPALRYLGDAECSPSPAPREILCSTDRADTFRPFGTARTAALVEARAELNEDHTAWSTTLVFAPADRRAVERAVEEATSTGGVVLLIDPGGEVLMGAGATDVEDGRIVLNNLDKPAAWAIVKWFTTA